MAGTLTLVRMADAIRDDADLAVVGRLRETAAELSGALGHDNSTFERKIHPLQRGGQ